MLFIKNLYSGGLITNYDCSSECAHCLYASSPRRPKMFISPETAAENFRKIKSMGCPRVHIGGGEPMLRRKELIEVLESAKKEAVGIEYIETNSSWYKSEKETRDYLREIIDAGVNTLLLSISPFHNSYIPFKKVKGVMAACKKTGMGTFPWKEIFYSDIDSFDDETPHSLSEYKEKFGKDYVQSLIWKYSLTLKGRSLESFEEYFGKEPLEKILAQNPGGCSELTNTTHFHIDLYGNYIPGLCPGLSIHRDDLGKPLSEDEYPCLSLLASGGINALYTVAKEEFSFEPEEKYASKCELCQKIRKFIVNEKLVSSADLKPEDFYTELESENQQ